MCIIAVCKETLPTLETLKTCENVKLKEGKDEQL